MFKEYFALLLMVFSVTCIFAMSFDEGIANLADLTAAKITPKAGNNLVIAKIDTYPKNNDNFNNYLMQKLAQNLLEKKVQVLDPAEVTPIVNKFLQKKSFPLDYKGFDALSFEIFSATEKAATLYLFGRAEIVDDSIYVVLGFLNPQTAKTTKRVYYTLPMDKTSDRLLNIVRAKKEEPKEEIVQPITIYNIIFITNEIAPTPPQEVKKEEPKAEPAPVVKEQPKSKPQPQPAGIIYKEDFSGYEIGDMLTDNGSNLVIVKGPDGRKYVTTQSKSYDLFLKALDLPKDFVLSFDFIGEGNVFDCTFTFVDNETLETNFLFGNEYRYWAHVQKMDRVEFEPRNFNMIKIIKKGDVCKFLVNGNFIQSVNLDNTRQLKQFKLKFNSHAKFTNFLITLN